MPFLQLIASIGVGLVLFRLLRYAAADCALSIIVVTGFLARAVAGIALFWISYLRLPVARGLQMGEGLWFFALDALQYYPQALAAAHKGVVAIAAIPRTSASVSFVQVLATSLMLFGDSAATAVFLNLICYAATCAILVTWLARETSARVPVTVAVAAVSFAPSSILWSAQPLKDTFFQFIIVVFVAACALWQRRWRESARPAALVAPAAVMMIALSAIAGVRWYFAFALLIASFGFALLLPLTVPRKRIAAAAVSFALLFVMSRVFLLVAKPYVPPAVDRALEPWHVSKVAVTAVPQTLTNGIVSARRGFEASGGSTQIGAGDNMATLDSGEAVARRTEGADVTAHPAKTHSDGAAASIDRTGGLSHGGSNERPTDAAPTTALASAAAPRQAPEKSQVLPVSDAMTTQIAQLPRQEDPALNTAAPPAVIPTGASPPTIATQPQFTLASNYPQPVSTEAPPPMTSAASSSDGNVIPQPKAEAAPEGKSDQSTSAQTQRVAETSHRGHHASKHRAPEAARRFPAVARPHDTVRHSAAAKTAAPVVAEQTARVPAAPHQASAPASAPAILPQSHLVRFLTGATAALVPRTVAQHLGVIQIDGGRGLLWFSEVDTLFFDLIIACAVALLLRRRASVMMNPLFWLVLLVLLLVGVPLVYAVTNFGTLFRLRGMLLTAVALLPAVVAADPAEFLRFRRRTEVAAEG